MNKILIIGSPGAGKSTFAKQLGLVLKYPILHLDRVFHINNNHTISKEELKSIITDFALSNNKWIIDGNYNATLQFRSEYADTIIFMKIPGEICLDNIYKRQESSKYKKCSDIASGFDGGIVNEEFSQFVRDFEKNNYPRINEVLSSFKGKVIEINSYEEKENFIQEEVILKQ
ncbi:topology modulation protein [Mycoplasmatota bacterium]|nr:topology modulation protein [Mycoplasmatota bacterium]